MTNNPLTMDRPRCGPMEPGDIRTYTARDPKTGDAVKELTIRRSNREYVYDLCDAYNAARPHGGMEYFVLNGEVKLGQSSDHRRPQPDYKPTDEDAQRIREYVAAAMADGLTQAEFNAYVRKTGGCPIQRMENG